MSSEKSHIKAVNLEMSSLYRAAGNLVSGGAVSGISMEIGTSQPISITAVQGCYSKEGLAVSEFKVPACRERVRPAIPRGMRKSAGGEGEGPGGADMAGMPVASRLNCNSR